MKTFLTALFSFVLIPVLYAESDITLSGQDSMVLHITVENERILPYEPIYLAYSVSNACNHAITINGNWKPAVFIKKHEDINWEQVARPYVIQSRPLSPTPMVFNPGESPLQGVCSVDVRFDGTHCFSHVDSYELKVAISGIESEAIQIVVEQSSNLEDLNAQKFLLDTGSYVFFSDEMNRDCYLYPRNALSIDTMELLLAKYPNSRYADWAYSAIVMYTYHCTTLPREDHKKRQMNAFDRPSLSKSALRQTEYYRSLMAKHENNEGDYAMHLERTESASQIGKIQAEMLRKKHQATPVHKPSVSIIKKNVPSLP